MVENLFYIYQLESACRFATSGFHFISFLFLRPHELYALEIEFRITQSNVGFLYALLMLNSTVLLT